MGSNLAVAYATIYYAYHEETTILLPSSNASSSMAAS